VEAEVEMSFVTTSRWRPRRAILIGGTTLLVIAVLVFAAYTYFSATAASRSGGDERQGTRNLAASLPPPNLLRPISPEEALEANAQRAFSARPDSPAAAFNLKTDLPSSDRALECLAQAVYYEAATEGADGQRAVAQIVLNRMRHPGYPASVCGVVYQGSERATGCQFSFTCDGSLARIPSAWAWKQAHEIARAALRGAVYAPVGHATHYHADYVLPYWADSLDKMVQIGRHIFYRLKGSLGSSRAFSQRYVGSEPAVLTPAPVAIPVDDPVDIEVPVLPIEDPAGLRAFAGELIGSPTNEAPLADATAGKLLSDGDGPAEPVSPAKKPVKPCQSPDDSVRLKPLATSEMRQSSQPSC
jgi:spore germination cell wall hydrolase CwlJ-like protein